MIGRKEICLFLDRGGEMYWPVEWARMIVGKEVHYKWKYIYQRMITGIIYIERFIDNSVELFELLRTTVQWNEGMATRKTASFGKAYNYSQMNYPFQEFLPELEQINRQLNPTIGFEPNNCLINYYLDGKSKMGYHSDQTDILEAGTGVAIVSIGEARSLRFRNILKPEDIQTYDLPAGSLIYMTQEVQINWQHAIPKADTDKGRISLTFRKII